MDHPFFQIDSGGDRNFAYLIGCQVTREAFIVDPSPDPIPIEQKLWELSLELKYIINTHSHADHSAGNSFFKRKYATELVTYHSLPWQGDGECKDQIQLSLDQWQITFFHTPGHTDDSICLQVENELLTGDTLFVGKVGGTYSRDQAFSEFNSLRKLMMLSGHLRVWPGHNYGISAVSTIDHERKTNPFCLRLSNFDQFLWLKDNWIQYKKEHGIL